MPPDDGELTDEALRALPMAGDVNLFFKGKQEDEDFEVEVEIMIAGWRCCAEYRAILAHLYLQRNNSGDIISRIGPVA